MLPEKEVQKRLAKAQKEAKKKGRNLSDEYKSRATPAIKGSKMSPTIEMTFFKM